MLAAKLCSKCGASMQGKVSFYGMMIVQLHECEKCRKVSIISDFPDTLDIKLIRQKMGYTKHFGGELK